MKNAKDAGIDCQIYLFIKAAKFVQDVCLEPVFSWRRKTDDMKIYLGIFIFDLFTVDQFSKYL